MIRSLLRYLKGYVKIRVEGYSAERFLNMCSFHQIYIWGLCPVENTYEMYLDIPGLKKIRPIARKTHTRIHILERHGFSFFLLRYRKRKLFFAGLFFCIVLLKTYSLFIWDIHFEGNRKWPDETLLEFLDKQGVAPSMLKSNVDCPGIVKAIRGEYNDIVWVSASIDGSLLEIRIKENEDTFQDSCVQPDDDHSDTVQDESGQNHSPLQDSEVSGQNNAVDLVAADDGIITDIVTRTGVPQVHKGDEVKAGDILVLGRVDILNDSGEVIGYEYRHSDADIYADTEMEYADSISLTYDEKVYTGKSRHQPYVRVFGWTVSFGTLKAGFEYSDTSTDESRLKLGENFYLPFSLGMRSRREYTLEERTYTREIIQQELSARFALFCGELEEKGVQIRGNSVKIHIGSDSATASGTLYLNQRITREADTEILMIERKEPDESVGTDN